MSDFHATEKIIGGAVVVGVASLLAWNASQASGRPGLVFVAGMIVGAVLVVIGLVELAAGPRLQGEQKPLPAAPPGPDGSDR